MQESKKELECYGTKYFYEYQLHVCGVCGGVCVVPLSNGMIFNHGWDDPRLPESRSSKGTPSRSRMIFRNCYTDAFLFVSRSLGDPRYRYSRLTKVAFEKKNLGERDRNVVISSTFSVASRL